MGLGAGEKRIITAQLGRKPRGLQDVARRCPWGFPQVLLTAPLVREGSEVVPFPTVLWLSCPELCTMVSHLEEKGLIGKWQEEMGTDRVLRERMREVHSSYACLRRNLIPEKELVRLQKKFPAQARVLTSFGVGGVSDPCGIKCLHAHLADFLVRDDNPLGERVYSRLRKSYFAGEGCGRGLCGLLEKQT